jgi:hypothetical protein
MEHEAFKQIVIQEISAIKNRISQIRDKMAETQEADRLKLQQEELYFIQRKSETSLKEACKDAGRVKEFIDTYISDRIRIIYHDLSKGK